MCSGWADRGPSSCGEDKRTAEHHNEQLLNEERASRRDADVGSRWAIGCRHAELRVRHAGTTKMTVAGTVLASKGVSDASSPRKIARVEALACRAQPFSSTSCGRP